MALWGPWQDSIESALGIQRSSGDRSQASQDALWHRGATSAHGPNAPHVIPDNAIDIPTHMDPAAAASRLADAGVRGYILDERAPGMGTGPHLHIQRTAPAVRAANTATRSTTSPDLANWNAAGTGTPTGPSDPTLSIRDQPVARNTTPISRVNVDDLLNGVESAANANPQVPPGGAVPNGDGQPLVNPFTIVGAARTASSTVDRALEATDKFTAHYNDAMTQMEADRRTRTEQAVADRAKINDTVQGETQSMIDRVQPALAARAQTAAQLEHIAGMNPLARGLRGIFDLNYNTQHLQDQLGRYDQVIQAQGQNYEFMTGIRERLLHTITAGQENSAQIDDLTKAELDEQGRSAGLALQGAQGHLAAIGNQVQLNESLVHAQIQQTDRFLSQQTAAQLAGLEAQASRAPGHMITVDGTQLSLGEVHARRNAAESQDLSLRSAQMAVQNQQIELADRHATQWARNATQTQIEAAIQNGGVVNGVHIPQDVLTAQLGDRMHRVEMQTGTILQGNQMDSLGRELQQFGTTITGTGGRINNVFGGRLPDELASFYPQYQRQMGEFQRQIEAANANPSTRGAVAGQLREQLGHIQQDYSERIGRAALQMAGGDQRAAGWLRTYLVGGHLDPASATDAMMYYAERGGLPPGLRASPEARASLAQTQQIINGVDQEIAGGHSMTTEQRSNTIRQRIQATVGGGYHNGNFNNFVSALPDIATRLHDQFAGVSRSDFAAAAHAADSIPFENIGRHLGISADDARALFSGRYNGPNAEQLRAQVPALSSQLAASQMSTFAEYLDRSPSAHEGFIPSQAFANFLQRPEVHTMASNYSHVSQDSTYGDFMIHAMTGPGQVEDRFSSWAQSFGNAAAANRSAQMVGSNQQRFMYVTSPQSRANVVLSIIPGINQADAARLISAAMSQMPPGAGGDIGSQAAGIADSWSGGRISHMPESQNQFRDIIVNQRFQDPALERIRRVAASHWDQSAALADQAVHAFNR